MLLFLASALAADPFAEVADTADLSIAQVKEALAGIEKDQTILDRMARPWEAQPWYRYQALFLKPDRIADGRAFEDAHGELFSEVSTKTGVPTSYLLAILAVETRFGQTMGNDDVLRSLFTIGMYHPTRGPFFRKELGHFLRLCEDEGWDRRAVRGSYAGAMGMGQFIPSSYRRHAVDGDGDGVRDLFENPSDAIASIANYFVNHGWRPGEPVLLPLEGHGLEALVTSGLKTDKTWGDLGAFSTSMELSPGTPVMVVRFETEDGYEYRLGLHNFAVIMRYNRSPLYARVVFELATQFEDSPVP